MRGVIKQWISAVVVGLITILSLELSLQVAYRFREGIGSARKWRFRLNFAPHERLFIRHPYLVGTPRPSITFGSVAHNSLGFRGPEIAKKKFRIRVVALGGSTTYGTLVDDKLTWPALLQEELGSNYEVINLGVPGYSTSENLIQTALFVSELQPDVSIYFEGWNDLRNMYIENLKSDYSDFHAKSQASNLGLADREPHTRSATLYYLYKLLRQELVPNHEEDLIQVKGTQDSYSANPDDRALGFYKRNLSLIVAINKALGIRPILVPQVLNFESLTASTAYGWVPFIKDKDLKTCLAYYNNVMENIPLKGTGGLFARKILRYSFSADDFVDQGHFSVQGNKKFASIMAEYVRSMR